MDRISLWYCEGASDKVYQAEIVPVSDGLQVNFAYGRRGGTMNTGTKTSKPMPYAQARKIFDTLVHAKIAKGYEPMGAPIKVFTSVGGDKRTPSGYKPQLLNAIEEADLEMYFKDPAYMMQEKMDGARRMAKKLGGDVFGINRKGEVVALPEQIAAEMRKLPDCVLDGEQVGDVLFGSPCTCCTSGGAGFAITFIGTSDDTTRTNGTGAGAENPPAGNQRRAGQPPGRREPPWTGVGQRGAAPRLRSAGLLRAMDGGEAPRRRSDRLAGISTRAQAAAQSSPTQAVILIKGLRRLRPEYSGTPGRAAETAFKTIDQIPLELPKSR